MHLSQRMVRSIGTWIVALFVVVGETSEPGDGSHDGNQDSAVGGGSHGGASTGGDHGGNGSAG